MGDFRVQRQFRNEKFRPSEDNKAHDAEGEEGERET